MVRGLDYYVRTAFEIVAAGLGAQNAVGGGGRYDGLVAALGGPRVPGSASRSASSGSCRVREVARGRGGARSGRGAARRDAARRRRCGLARRLRGRRAVELEPPGRSLKALLRRADKLGARYAIIIGEDELPRGPRDRPRPAAARGPPLALALDAPGPELARARARRLGRSRMS